MNKMYILGCSHASGSELQGLGIGHNTEYNLQNSFAAQFSIRMGYVPINLAIPGGSNDYIYRIFNEIIEEKYKPGDIFFISWTGTHRMEVFDYTKDEWYSIAQGQKWQPSDLMKEAYEVFNKVWMSHELTGHHNKMKNILALDSIAKTRNINVIHHDSFAPLHFPEKLEMLWLNPVRSFMEWAIKKNYAHTPSFHFELQAHSDYAEFLHSNYKSLV